MPANDALVFSTLARCFAPVSEHEWREITAASAWLDFLDGARELVQGRRLLGNSSAPAVKLRPCGSLSSCLAQPEVRALFAPPSFAEKQAFASRHFTGGLPQSALPVESLYTRWAKPGMGAFSGRCGLYLGESALYMRDLAVSMGFEIPEEFSACPDHLAVELEFVAVLLEDDGGAEARLFMHERFGWLTDYRKKLMSLGEAALFYLACIDLVIGMRACRENLPEQAASA